MRSPTLRRRYCNWLDSGRRAPEGLDGVQLAGRRLLDVGCSFGRHLATFQSLGADAIGVDLEENYLQLSRVFAEQQGLPAPRVARATATNLPFPSESFDVVFCRLVLNYVPVRPTLAEFRRVLARRGVLIVSFLTFDDTWKFVKQARWRGNLRTIAWRLFGLMNTIVMETAGRQLTVRARGRMYAAHTPTWPTPLWVGRELTRQGFSSAAGGFRVHDSPVVIRAIRQ